MPPDMPQPEAVTHRRVLRIALPIVLSNATVPLLGAVDTGVIGQLGEAAPLGAVGLGAVILASFYWIFGFLRMGTTGFVAQARGAGDAPEAAAHLARALLVAGAAGAVLVLAQQALWAAAFAISPASAEVENLARQYLAIRIWGAPATIALYALTGWLIAHERTRGVLVLQLWMNGLNIGLDIWFVLGLGWGIGGVASATLIAEYAGLAMAFWLCRGAFAGGLWPDRARLLHRATLWRMFVVNGDIMLRSILLQGAFTTFTLMGAGRGDVTLAANQVLIQFMEITAYALDGFAFAAEALVGTAIGARSRKGLSQAAKITSLWGVGGALALGLFFALAGPWLIDLLTTAPDVRLEARNYLYWVALLPVVGIASWMFDGIFIGATWTRAMRNMMAISVACYAIALTLLVPAFGNHGLWLALLVLLAARGVTMALAYPRLAAGVGR